MNWVMTGAIAGTAILHSPEDSRSLHTVALTINNQCNFSCPYCYLQYDGPAGDISRGTADYVLNSQFERLAIVGKEPCLSPEMLEYIVKKNHLLGRKTSMITNGSAIDSIPRDILSCMDYVDVSLDVGLKPYNRQGDLSQILSGIQGLKAVNALHTLYQENLQRIDEMVAVSREFPFARLAFSPFKKSYNHGSQSVTHSSLTNQLLPSLARSKSFMETESAILLVSNSDLIGCSEEGFLKVLDDLSIRPKVFYSPNPLRNGLVRVTYDGFVLSPDDSIHPGVYKSKGINVKDDRFRSLNDIFSHMKYGLVMR